MHEEEEMQENGRMYICIHVYSFIHSFLRLAHVAIFEQASFLVGTMFLPGFPLHRRLRTQVQTALFGGPFISASLAASLLVVFA